MKKINKFAVLLILLASIIPFVHASAQAKSGEQIAEIFYNEACGMCADFVRDGLPQMLTSVGINEFVNNDYVNEKQSRVEMNKRMDELNIPIQLQSHIMTFVGDKYVLGGHVPEHIINDIFSKENESRFKRIIVYQDLMHGDVEDYKVLAIPNYSDTYVGEIKTYPIDVSVTEYLDYIEANEDELSRNKGNSLADKSLLPVVLASGFLDGINPCAFAVLLLFIAFLISIKKGRSSIWKMGAVYVSAIFLAYLLIGFGLLKAIMFVNSPHFMAKLGAWLIIFLGAVNVFNHYSSKKIPLKMGIPSASKSTIHKWMHKSTLPAAFVMGFLVGLCTFPCSGGIYVAIIGLLVAKTTYWTGVSYLILYNLMFVLPLILILIFAANKYSFVKFGEWQQNHKKTQKLIMGIVMLLLGVGILIFFVN